MDRWAASSNIAEFEENDIPHTLLLRATSKHAWSTTWTDEKEFMVYGGQGYG
jgi:hypothetical protein